MRNIIIGFVLVCISPVLAQYVGGNGTADDPYLIWTPKQISVIGTEPNNLDKHFKFMADIDLNGVNFNTIGSHAGPFSGVLDGNGYAISNFTGTEGLFRYVDGPNAEIKNLGLIDPNVVGGPYTGSLISQLVCGTVFNCYVDGGSTSDGMFYTGGLIGSNSAGTIDKCHNSGRVSASRHTVGGLVGWNGDHGTIIDCSSSAQVSSFAMGGEIAVGGLVGDNRGGIGRCYCTGAVAGRFTVGGLVGFNGSGVVADSYSHSSVTADQFGVGGLIGSNVGIVVRCYAAGAVVGGSDVGGLVGRNGASVTDCFWDIETSGQKTSAGGMGETTVAMKQEMTFTDWDFAEVWDIAESQTYPFLRRRPIGDLNYDCRVDMRDLAILAEQWLEGIE